MATEELTVKFKVDSAQVKTGADQAKSQVKQASKSMEGDVKSASSSMEKNLDRVSDSAKKIGGAAAQAGTGVKNLEQQVTSSSTRMSASLDDVAKKVKSISAMQVAGVASRGLGIAANAVRWAGENFTEEGSTGRELANAGAGALSGAGQGVMLGAAVGSIIPGLGTAVGAALGGAVGALAGAASALWDSAQELKKSAQERQESASKYLQQQGKDLDDREMVQGWDRENQALLKGFGQTWWQSKDGTRKISGEERVFKVQEEYQRNLDRATARRDEYAAQHRWDTGEEAVESARYLLMLNTRVDEAARHLQHLQPVVDAARKSIADQERAAQDEAKAREAAARASEAASVASLKDQQRGVKDDIKEHQGNLASLQAQLQGVVSRPANAPTDALTRIGGGRGYTAYNNSTANVQMKIENHLKELIKVEQSQLTDLNAKLENLTNLIQGGGLGATWGA